MALGWVWVCRRYSQDFQLGVGASGWSSFSSIPVQKESEWSSHRIPVAQTKLRWKASSGYRFECDQHSGESFSTGVPRSGEGTSGTNGRWWYWWIQANRCWSQARHNHSWRSAWKRSVPDKGVASNSQEVEQTSGERYTDLLGHREWDKQEHTFSLKKDSVVRKKEDFTKRSCLTLLAPIGTPLDSSRLWRLTTELTSKNCGVPGMVGRTSSQEQSNKNGGKTKKQ